MKFQPPEITRKDYRHSLGGLIVPDEWKSLAEARVVKEANQNESHLRRMLRSAQTEDEANQIRGELNEAVEQRNTAWSNLRDAGNEITPVLIAQEVSDLILTLFEASEDKAISELLTHRLGRNIHGLEIATEDSINAIRVGVLKRSQGNSNLLKQLIVSVTEDYRSLFLLDDLPLTD